MGFSKDTGRIYALVIEGCHLGLRRPFLVPHFFYSALQASETRFCVSELIFFLFLFFFQPETF